MGWGLFIGWEEVFSLCFLRSLFHASNMAAEGLGAAGDDSEEEQEIHCGPGYYFLYLQGCLYKFGMYYPVNVNQPVS